MHFDQAWEVRSGKLYRNDRLAEQVARQPVHYDMGIDRPVREVLAGWAICLTILFGGIGFWWAIIHGVMLWVRR